MSLQPARDAVDRWIEAHPHLTGWILWISVAGVGLFLAGVASALVFFVVGLSGQGAAMCATLTLGLWAALSVPFLLWRDKHARYGRGFRNRVTRAEEGDAKARWQMVEGYLHGTGGHRKDVAQAVWWLQQLAESGDAEAAFQLAHHHEHGHGVFRDRGRAKALLQQAAEAGHAAAQEKLKPLEEDKNP